MENIYRGVENYSVSRNVLRESNEGVLATSRIEGDMNPIPPPGHAMCVYSAEVWREVTLRAIINWPALPWERAWEWAAKEFTNRSNPNQNLVGMILAATIYHLWAERNNRLHMQGLLRNSGLSWRLWSQRWTVAGHDVSSSPSGWAVAGHDVFWHSVCSILVIG
ncbi:hypothetical protein OIU84_024514 [Salix udensis]|uniref:Uncharacterized protein n=1 Tax=Salix udensis TaxID=889485 RepID=A0AAD6KJ88_9ROSI|nr:hypothetical protein OIU84_024514 [Salix udensis]